MKRIGIIGFGAVCENANIPAIKKLSNYFIPISVFDPIEERRKKAVEILKIKECSSIEEMLNSKEIECVVITSPPALHKEIIIKALEKGIDVLCEKPLCLSMKEFDEIADAVRYSGKIVYSVHNWIYSPHIIKIKSLIEEIGKITYLKWDTLRKKPSISASTNWRVDKKISGGGIIFDHGWHVFYIIKSFIGDKEPKNVNASFIFNDNGIDEVCDLRIIYENTIVDIHLSWKSPVRKNMIVVYGENGILIFNDSEVELEFKNSEKKEFKFEEKISASSAHPLWTEKVYIDFYYATNDKKIFEKNFMEARNSISIIEKAYASIG